MKPVKPVSSVVVLMLRICGAVVSASAEVVIMISSVMSPEGSSHRCKLCLMRGQLTSSWSVSEDSEIDQHLLNRLILEVDSLVVDHEIIAEESVAVTIFAA